MMKEQEMNLFSDLFKNLPDEILQKEAVVCGHEHYTYSELEKAVNLCASDLIDLGVKPGDHVGLWSFNSINSIIAFLAIIKIGAVCVLGNYSAGLEDSTELFRKTDIKFLVFGTVLASRNDAVVPFSLAAELGLKTDALYDITSTTVSFRDRLSDFVPNAEVIRQLVDNDTAGRSAFIIFTTGSTSSPKAVLCNQKGFLLNMRRMLQKRGPLMGDRVCVALPLFHIFGLTAVFGYLLNHSTVYLTDRVGARSVIDYVSEYNITDISSVSAIMLDMTELSDFHKISSIVKLLITAGGVFTPVQFIGLEKSFDNAKLFNEYGQTECHGYITSSNFDATIEQRAYTIGRPADDGEVKIDAPEGQIGEILVRGDTLKNGYYGLSDEQQGIDQDGWLHTGDLAYVQNGDFVFAGRIKDIIIKNGENISPLEIESELIKYDEITNVKVFGAPHRIYGESVECCVCLKENTVFHEDEVKKKLKSVLGSAKVPSNFFIFEEFPLAANGKLDQRTLRIDMLNRLKEQYISESLYEGIVALKLTIKNDIYNISPITSMMDAFVSSMGYSKKKINRITLSVEEFLTERICNSSINVGDISVQCIFRKEWFRIVFHDCGFKYDLEKDQATSLSAKIIAKCVDAFSAQPDENGMPVYIMDFTYDESFSIDQYLLKYSRDLSN